MILGIESSCDESALCLYDPARGVVGEWINSQIEGMPTMVAWFRTWRWVNI